MEQLVRDRQAFCWLDAAQLVKHAFGLAYTFPNRATALLYLFWEPPNSNAYPIFAAHRAEVTRFAASIRGASLQFIAMSYAELWALWDAQPQFDWIPAHVSRLRARYAVEA
jgi:hypothetical protein